MLRCMREFVRTREKCGEGRRAAENGGSRNSGAQSTVDERAPLTNNTGVPKPDIIRPKIANKI